jgi:hypothetical protein
MPSELRLELIRTARDPVSGTDMPYLYRVNGLPSGYSAEIRSKHGSWWQYRLGLSNQLGEWTGDYDSADEVLDHLRLLHLL